MSVITPTSLVGARSPIYVTANYSSISIFNNRCRVERFIFGMERELSKPASPQYTLFRDVFAGTDVSFDIAPLVA